MLAKFLSGFHLRVINAEEHGWNDCFFRNEAGQSKNMKGLMHVVACADSLNVSLNFGTCKTKYNNEQGLLQLVLVYLSAF